MYLSKYQNKINMSEKNLVMKLIRKEFHGSPPNWFRASLGGKIAMVATNGETDYIAIKGQVFCQPSDHEKENVWYCYKCENLVSGLDSKESDIVNAFKGRMLPEGGMINKATPYCPYCQHKPMF